MNKDGISLLQEIVTRFADLSNFLFFFHPSLNGAIATFLLRSDSFLFLENIQQTILQISPP